MSDNETQGSSSSQDSDSREEEEQQDAVKVAKNTDMSQSSLQPSLCLPLPAAADAFFHADGQPDFLSKAAFVVPAFKFDDGDKEGQQQGKQQQARASEQHQGFQQGRGEGFDVASLAPPLKGTKVQRSQGAVISQPAKRYKPDPEATQQYTASQVALMGGRVNDSQQDSNPAGSDSVQAVGVEEFISQGGKGALPRQQQQRKDKEKKKRQLGQSSVSGWKSELEMAMRQQYD